MDVGNLPEEPVRWDRQTPIEDLVPAVVLGAADAQESAAVLRHAGDPDVAAALTAYGELADALLLAVPAAAPPPRLAANLRAALERAPDVVQTSGALVAERSAAPAPGASAPRRAWHWPQILAAAASAACLLLLMLNLYWLREIGMLRQDQAALRQQLQDQATEFTAQLAKQEQVVADQAERITQQDQLVTSLMAETGERYAMHAVQPDSPAVAQVAWLEDANLAVLRAEGFPPLEPGKAYQLWLIRGDQRTSGGLFTVDPSGCGTLVFHPSESLDAFDGMGITPEPATGSPGPTAPPVVRAQL